MNHFLNECRWKKMKEEKEKTWKKGKKEKKEKKNEKKEKENNLKKGNCKNNSKMNFFSWILIKKSERKCFFLNSDIR